MAMRLSRRTVLRGIGGAVVGLPVLECMLNDSGTAFAQTPGGVPKRYAYLFAGMACGGDGIARDRSRLNGQNFTEDGLFIAPSTTGTNYDLTLPLEPIADLRDYVSIVSNTRIPYNTSGDPLATIPAGGAYRGFHGGAASPLLCGVSNQSTSSDPQQRQSQLGRFTAHGPTPDRLLAQMHADAEGGVRGDYSMVFRAQPSFYISGYSFAGRQYISYDGARDPVSAQDSPQVAYQSLFGNFVPGDPDEAARASFTQRARLSVLDAISQRRQRLVNRVGRADRQRLERHFDEIRDLENRLAALPPDIGGECISPDDPGPDPSVGGDNAGAGADNIQTNTGYSNEDLRARLFVDFIHMAFVCDIARAATLQITTFQCHMNSWPVTQGRMAQYPSSNPSGYTDGVRADIHEMGHNGDPLNRGQLPMSVALQWHIDIYADLVRKLRDTPEGDGNVLDNSAIVFSPETGHGAQLDASGNDPDNQTHTSERIPLLVSGRAGGLTPGQHIDGQANVHPAQVQLSAMQACGYAGDTLGEVSGRVDALFG